ncbi:MAG: 2Fe-2S iron-sulfur cluster binding domain-containing protein [Alteromonadaceae bacterium]|nr:2Fe-2S iron-sulfur cluster binding domain-containing protein [Alteromonadaceae bacterium]
MITVSRGNSVSDIPVTGTLLESLERASVPVETHCRSGVCGLCRMKLKSGNVEYIETPLGWVEDDEVLVCCAVPTSQKIEIEVL